MKNFSTDDVGGDNRTGVVVRLPCADGSVISQRIPRSDRMPKDVISLWRARFDRSQAATVLALEAQLKLALQMRNECYQRSKVLIAELKEAEERDKSNAVEYDVLHSQVKAIEAQIAQAAKGGRSP